MPAEFVSSVQGARVVEAQPASSSQGGLTTKRCFYRTDSFNRSVDVEITAEAGQNGHSGIAVDLWNRRFHSARVSEEEEEEEFREKQDAHSSTNAGREEEEERAKAKPSPVTGLGDEAFWVSNQLNSTLHVRQGSVLLRISLGGPDDGDTKLQRARSLADRILTGQK